MTYKEAELNLLYICNIEFLENLREAARLSGWGADYPPIRDFVRELYYIAGREITDKELEPYELTEAEDKNAIDGL